MIYFVLRVNFKGLKMKVLSITVFVVVCVALLSACTSPLTIFPMSQDNAFQIKKADLNARFSVGLSGKSE